MYATKQARQFLEKHPKSMAFIFYIDLRAFGKGYEEFYESAAREYGIYYIRGRIGDVYENENGDIVVRGEDTLLQQLLEIDTDMMVLSVGLEPRADSEQVAKMFDLLKSEDGQTSGFDGYECSPFRSSSKGYPCSGLYWVI